MHISYITCVFPPYKSGIGEVVYGQAVEMAKRGHEVNVFTPRYSSSYAKSEEISGVKVYRLKPWLMSGNAAFIPQLYFQLKNSKIVHLHYPFFGGAETALLYILMQKFKIFFNVKAQAPMFIVSYHMDYAAAGFKNIINVIYKKTILYLVLKTADKILVSTFDYIENSDIKKYFIAHKQRFIELPFATAEIIATSADNLKTKYQIEDNEKVILFVGALDKPHYFKGLEYLLKALQMLQATTADAGQASYPPATPERSDGGRGMLQAKLIVAGDGELKSYYQKMAVDLKIEKNVLFIGSVEAEVKWQLYRLCDVFVLPSVNKGEAFGMVLLEAMANGKPIIASNLPGVRTLIEDGINGYKIKPADYNDLSEKIKIILSDDVLAKKMGENGLAMISEKYNNNKIMEQLEKIYLSH